MNHYRQIKLSLEKTLWRVSGRTSQKMLDQSALLRMLKVHSRNLFLFGQAEKKETHKTPLVGESPQVKGKPSTETARKMLFSVVALSATPETAPLVNPKGQRRKRQKANKLKYSEQPYTRQWLQKKSEIAEDNGGPSREARDPTIEPK